MLVTLLITRNIQACHKNSLFDKTHKNCNINPMQSEVMQKTTNQKHRTLQTYNHDETHEWWTVARVNSPMVLFVLVDLDRFPRRAIALFCSAGLDDCNSGLMYLRPLSFWTIVWLSTFDTYKIRHGENWFILHFKKSMHNYANYNNYHNTIKALIFFESSPAHGQQHAESFKWN